MTWVKGRKKTFSYVVRCHRIMGHSLCDFNLELFIDSIVLYIVHNCWSCNYCIYYIFYDIAKLTLNLHFIFITIVFKYNLIWHWSDVTLHVSHNIDAKINIFEYGGAPSFWEICKFESLLIWRDSKENKRR